MESILDKWANATSELLMSGSKMASLYSHGGLIGEARESLVKHVLEKIVPSAYEIGSGEIIDSFGNKSKQIDVIIARKDLPTFQQVGSSKIFLLESVIATIEVKSHLDREELFGALDNVASVIDLKPIISKQTSSGGLYSDQMKKEGFKESAPEVFTHDNPIEVARWGLLHCPETYIFGFKGYKSSPKALGDALNEWINNRSKKKQLEFGNVPSLIITEGCALIRNSEPYIVDTSENVDMDFYAGEAEGPLRILIKHLLFSILKKVRLAPDLNNFTPNLHSYLATMKSPFKTEMALGWSVISKPNSISYRKF